MGSCVDGPAEADIKAKLKLMNREFDLFCLFSGTLTVPQCTLESTSTGQVIQAIERFSDKRLLTCDFKDISQPDNNMAEIKTGIVVYNFNVFWETLQNPNKKLIVQAFEVLFLIGHGI